jgi:hypothetical protein
MSKTYKTNPSWVKLRRKSSVRQERHNHVNNECNITLPTAGDRQIPFWGRNDCYYTVNYYGYNNGFYGRGRGSWVRAEIRLRHGADRARLRRDSHEMLKLSREDIQDYDVVNPRPRNGVLWDWH